MFGISRGKKRGSVAAVIDAGSGSVGFAVIETGHGQPVRVLRAQRRTLPAEERSLDAAVASIAQELRTLAGKILSEHAALDGRAVERTYCLMRAPFARSQTGQYTARFEEATPVRSKMLIEAGQKAVASISREGDASPLDACIVHVELDGYPTGKPLGKRARSLAVTSLASFAPAGVRSAIESAVQAVLPQRPSLMRGSSRALLSVLRTLEKSSDYLIVDVASDATTLIAVQGGIPREQALIAEGSSTILQRLSGSGMPEEILGLLRMAARDQCESEACNALMADFARIEPELVRRFGEGMAQYCLQARLPNRIVLLAHQDLSAWLARFFSRIDFTQFTQTAQPFCVFAPAQTDLSAYVETRGDLEIDSGLALACAMVSVEGDA